VFQAMRRSALASLGWDTIDGARLALIKAVIREQTVALLRSLAASRADGSEAGRPRRSAVARRPRSPRPRA
jgi:hypothetical protein